MIATLASTDTALVPIKATLRHMASRPGGLPVNGIAPDLTVADAVGWVPATELVNGAALDDLLDSARVRWQAQPHAAAALAWKCYSFWLALPAVLGYAVARRVPLPRPEGVVVRWSQHQPFLTVGLTSVEVAVLPNDPLALGGDGVRVVSDEEALLDAMRTTLMDEHLAPIIENIKARLHLGRRTLWGSLASGVAHGLSRAAEVHPRPDAGDRHGGARPPGRRRPGRALRAHRRRPQHPPPHLLPGVHPAGTEDLRWLLHPVMTRPMVGAGEP
jgi:hypothetical protein